MLGNFTCRQCRRTGRGENGYGTCHQNRPAKGVAVVGISRMGHSGAISYFVQQAARAGLIGISLCQSDPMVVPFGGAEIYYGTNPLAFAAPGEGDEIPPLIWRLPYRHGESTRRPLAQYVYPGYRQSIKTVHQQPIRSRYMLCSPPLGQKGMA